LSGGGVGAEGPGMELNLATDRQPETKTECSKILFAVASIALSLVLLDTKLLGCPVHSLFGVP